MVVKIILMPMSCLGICLKNSKLVDYEQLQNGGTNGIKLTAKLLLGNTMENVPMNFYKVAGTRSDPRFSIYGI